MEQKQIGKPFEIELREDLELYASQIKNTAKTGYILRVKYDIYDPRIEYAMAGFLDASDQAIGILQNTAPIADKFFAKRINQDQVASIVEAGAVKESEYNHQIQDLQTKLNEIIKENIRLHQVIKSKEDALLVKSETILKVEEEAKKAQEAIRAEEAKKAQEAIKKAQEAIRAEEAKKTEEIIKKTEEDIRAEEYKKTEEVIKKTEEVIKKTEEVIKKTEENNKKQVDELLSKINEAQTKIDKANDTIKQLIDAENKEDKKEEDKTTKLKTPYVEALKQNEDICNDIVKNVKKNISDALKGENNLPAIPIYQIVEPKKRVKPTKKKTPGDLTFEELMELDMSKVPNDDCYFHTKFWIKKDMVARESEYSFDGIDFYHRNPKYYNGDRSLYNFHDMYAATNGFFYVLNTEEDVMVPYVADNKFLRWKY